MAWIQEDNASFLIVTFIDAAKPQHNCSISFAPDHIRHELKMDSLSFEYPYARK